MRAARKTNSILPAGAVKRAAMFAVSIFILVVAPMASAAWQGQVPQPIALFSLTQDQSKLFPDPIEAQRIAALNQAIPTNPDLAVPAAPFTLSGSASQTSAIDCMTAAIYYEAANEPITGQRAVAQVVLNRVRHPAYPNSVCAVVFQGSERRTGCQFTFTCDGSLARRPARSGWLRAQTVAYSALSGLVEPSVGHATHYHASYVLPYWAKSLTKLETVGSHVFYQWRGPWANAKAFSDTYSGSETIPLPAKAALAGYLLAAYPEDATALAPQLGLGEIASNQIAPAASNRELRSAPPAGTMKASELNGSGLKVARPQLVVSGGRLKDDPSTGLIGEPVSPIAQ